MTTRHHFASLLLFLGAATAAASPIDIRAGAGRFADCELVEVGSRGAISGTMSLSELSSDSRWASALAFIITDDTKFQTSFRFALASVTASKNLEARYEFFTGSRRPVAEALGEAAVGATLPFHLSWNESGSVELSAGSSQPRKLSLDFKPTRVFLLVSGGRGRLELEGDKGVDCSRTLQPTSK
jgi:hypothetical protein